MAKCTKRNDKVLRSVIIDIIGRKCIKLLDNLCLNFDTKMLLNNKQMHLLNDNYTLFLIICQNNFYITPRQHSYLECVKPILNQRLVLLMLFFIQIHWQIVFALIWSLVIRSVRNFAHAMTALLSSHVHNFVVIILLKFRGEQSEISFELWGEIL